MPKIAIFLLTLLALNAAAQQCTVKASFTPNNDTTLYPGQGINYTNTSTNADSYEWIVDRYTKFNNTDFQYFPTLGITPIALVAHQGNCTDTAFTYIIRNGTPPADPGKMITNYGLPNSNEWAAGITAAKRDGYLLAGISGDYSPQAYSYPFFVRISENGCILWSRKLSPGINMVVRSLIATYDSGFVVQVVVKNDFDESYILKFDKDGNILWSRKYSGGAQSINWDGTIREMSNHTLWVLGGTFGQENFIITQLSETGNFGWQRIYSFNPTDFGYFADVVDQGGAAYIAGNYYQTIDANANKFIQYPLLFKVNATDGEMVWVKGYASPNTSYSWNGIHFYQGGLIMNGFTDSLTNTANARYDNFQTIQQTDIDGNITGAKSIYNNTVALPAPVGNNLFVNPDNSLLLFNSFSNMSFYLRLDLQKNITWQKAYFGANRGYLLQAGAAPAAGLAMMGNRFSTLLNPVYGIAENYFVLKVGADGEGSDPLCDQYVSVSVVHDLAVSPYTPPLPSMTNGTLVTTEKTVAASKPNSELRYTCPDYVPLCSFMKLSGEQSVCNLNDTLEFIAHKDPACGDPVIWTYDQSNTKTTFSDGSKLRLLFKTPGVYVIKAEKPIPCNPMVDSIIVTVSPALTGFTLGNDTTICPGDSIVLRANKKYDHYRWQDGSATDSIKVKGAGIYHLQVTDSCGNQKVDTIEVKMVQVLPLDLGSSRTKCASDTLQVNIPIGFVSYDWKPFYNSLIAAGGDYYLFPRVDTTYTLIVTDELGCRQTSTLAISIYPGSSVELGNDTAICAGGHVLFTANGNFTSYSWSNGSSNNSIDVSEAGNYVVHTTDANGCRASDSISLALYPLPDPRISGIKAICKDQNLVLNAGDGFSAYLWQDGSVSQQISVTDTGYFHVQVTDAHTCMGGDTVHIDSYAENPNHFLPADTSICMYGSEILQPNRDYIQYDWSTGENTRSIQITKAGIYTLKVVDASGCRGIDSIHIEIKDCDALLVFPNAFTPNGDGKNDVFRLRYPGIVANFKLQIYNRWGQTIYSSTDPYASWGGSLSGELQPEGVYVWILRYTDRAGKHQQQQGTVTLIR